MGDGWNGPLNKVDAFRYEIPRSYKPGMRTNGLVFIDESMVPQLRQDQAPEQVANVATMPGILGAAMAMPDIHWGYGFPIGGVAAFDYDEGVISPGGIGYDINCGVRLIRTNLLAADVRSNLRALTDACFENVPSGVGEGGITKVSRQDLAKLATEGAGWSVEKGYAWSDDPTTSRRAAASRTRTSRKSASEPSRAGRTRSAASVPETTSSRSRRSIGWTTNAPRKLWGSRSQARYA